jgi:hypothetical protein
MFVRHAKEDAMRYALLAIAATPAALAVWKRGRLPTLGSRPLPRRGHA